MKEEDIASSAEGQVAHMENYYSFQAKIYDATRWTFLYGRNTVLKKIPIPRAQKIKILEVGCGTGTNMRSLAKRFPNAEIYGMDVSKDMLVRAEQNLTKYKDRIKLLHQPYDTSSPYKNTFDVILFSYSLTMINPQWKDLLAQAQIDLKDGGYVTVADFHDANFKFYRRFMYKNHVKLEGHIFPVLKEMFNPHYAKLKPGAGWVWKYMMFVGKKK